MYYINLQNQQSNFNNVSMFLNGLTQENNINLNIVNFEFFIKFMKNNGFNLIESESYKTLYEMSKMNNLSEYENIILGLLKFCVFEPLSESNTSYLNPDYSEFQQVILPKINISQPIKYFKQINNGINLSNNENINLYKLERRNSLNIMSAFRYS
jgi:hypothetical protein